MIRLLPESAVNHFRKERAAPFDNEPKERLSVLYDMGSGGSNFSRMG